MNDSVIASRPYLRGVSHAVAAVAALVLAPIMVLAATPGRDRGLVAIYVVGIIGLFATSAAYHCLPWRPAARRVMQRIDHSMIFVAIAATYTPIAAFVLPARDAIVLLAVVWTAAVIGIVLRLVWTDPPRAAVVGPYLIEGWSILFVINRLWSGAGVVGFVLLLAGDHEQVEHLVDSTGALVYALRRPNPSPRWFGFHEVFHLLVIAGATAHYVCVAFVALPRA
jgi:hemolysin III